MDYSKYKEKVVTLPYDPTWQALEWAKKHCPGYITNGATLGYQKENTESGNRVRNITYYFDNEKDALLFLLMWGS